MHDRRHDHAQAQDQDTDCVYPSCQMLGECLGNSPAKATAEDLRLYQLHLVHSGMAAGNLNANLSGLSFFFKVTLERPEVLSKVSPVHEPRRLPEILSVEQVTRLIKAAGSLKYRSDLSVSYGAGMRADEVSHMKVSDIDSERLEIRVNQGKDSYAMLYKAMLPKGAASVNTT